MEIVAQRHKGDWRHKVIFTASTNKASSVLGSKVKKKGFNSSTLDKYFGLGQSQKSTNVYYDARQTQTTRGDFKGDYGDIVIIDEASMINKEKYNTIVEIAEQEGLKIIFLGDIAQLPPVGESISPVF
jgi:ATP-dependent exoDNAse (exonuclease V) alpha subunit